MTERPPRRLALVSTFPPRKDGIARYAEQLAQGLATEREVVRIGLTGSQADRIVRLDGGLRLLRLLGATRTDDDVWIMWHPEFFIAGHYLSRLQTYAALGVVGRWRRLEVWVHEPVPGPRTGHGILRKPLARVERAVQAWCWRSGAQLTFHSERERTAFIATWSSLSTEVETAVSDHGRWFRPVGDSIETSEARRRLSLDPTLPLFLCIGFIGRHKGFDRAIDAFAHIPPETAQLYVVGSCLYGTVDERDYLAELRARSKVSTNVHLEERFVDDEEFDLWIQAADILVAPYRAIASSSVVARARLIGTRVVASDVGALPEQLGPIDILVDSDRQLASTLARLAEERAAGVTPRLT